jgi:uncharacterized protein (DUF1697 family)
MATYISMLRGINVGGHKKILMADLRALYKKLKFSNIESYIQSGNVVFDTESKTTPSELAQMIEQAITKKYGFDVPVIIRTPEEIEHVISSNPYRDELETDIKRVYVSFLATNPAAANLEKLKAFDFAPDQYHVEGQDIFLCYGDRASNSKMTNNFFENKLKVAATSRNWRTVNKLYEMATNS